MRRLISAGLLTVVILAFIAGAVALIGAYTFIPPILEASVASDVQEQFDLTEAPDVRLESEPQPAVLTGNFSGGRVSLAGVEFGGVRAESAVVDLDAFRVDLVDSLVRGETVGEETISGDVRVRVTEAEISRLAGETASTPMETIELEDGRMLVRSSIVVFGIEVPVSVSGSLDLRGDSIQFEPDALEAAGVPIPDDVSDQLVSEASFAYPLRDLPDGTRLTDARVEDGSLVLVGEIEGLRLGASG